MAANQDSTTGKAEQRVYLVYDARARYAVSEASVLLSCDSVAEAQGHLAKFHGEGVIFSYKIENGETTGERREI